MKNKSRLSRIMIPALLAFVMVLAFTAITFADDEITMNGDNIEETTLVTEDLKNGIVLEGGSYYYYVDGEMQKAIKFELDGKLYFAKADGTLARNEKLKIDGEYYFAGSDCVLAANGVFANDKGAKYYADENGVVNTEATTIDDNGTGRVTNSTGQIKENQFIVSNGNTYYCGPNGKYATGIFRLSNGYTYYADPNTGIVAVTEQWVEYQGNKYRVTKGGALAGHTVIKIGDTYYWMNKSGALAATTFIIVDIANQRLGFYKDGALIVSCGIVTGKDSVGGTPKGDYAVTGLARNINLKGSSGNDTWDNHVDYWIAFIGSSIGLHDADWRASWEFNDPSRYHRNGSHGCVNMPYSSVKKIYETLYAMANHGKGVPVIVM